MRNVMTLATAWAVAASVGLLSTQPAHAQWGTLKGQVTLTGKIDPLNPLVKKGAAAARDPSVCAADDVPNESLVVDPATNGIANVVIWIVKKPDEIHPDLVKSKNAEVAFDQKGCRFIPHILLVRTDQKVRVLSGDAIGHNTHTHPLKNKPENFILTPEDRVGVLVPNVTMQERLPHKVTCDIHNWMEAYWVVLDHPYAAVTNAKGEFAIANLPVGEHKFIVWQEKCGYIDKTYTVTIKAGENKQPPIQVSAAKFN